MNGMQMVMSGIDEKSKKMILFVRQILKCLTTTKPEEILFLFFAKI